MYITPASGTSGVSGTGSYTAVGNGKIELNFTSVVSGSPTEYHCTMIMVKE
jgi:hypothetical protein